MLISLAPEASITTIWHLASRAMPEFKYSLDGGVPKITSGGWAKEFTIHPPPVSKGLAGVHMFLNPGASRELRCHAIGAEWACISPPAPSAATPSKRPRRPASLGAAMVCCCWNLVMALSSMPVKRGRMSRISLDERVEKSSRSFAGGWFGAAPRWQSSPIISSAYPQPSWCLSNSFR